MGFQNVHAERQLIRAKVLPLDPPWEGLLLPVSSFPVPTWEFPALRSFVASLGAALAPSANLATEVFIQFTQLHVDDGGSRLSDHAKDWMPQLGLGVWPDREPPTLWTKEDFELLPVGARPRQLCYQVFRICAPQRARAEARDLMFGRGAIIEVIIENPSEEFFAKSKAFLLPPIKEKSFHSFPFYLPLLEGKSARNGRPRQLENWLCGASAYIRESVEDNGILILSREPLTPILEQLGGKLEQAPEPLWRIPI
jgi:hypothetical protein